MLRAAQHGREKRERNGLWFFSVFNKQRLTGAIAFDNAGVPLLMVSDWVSPPLLVLELWAGCPLGSYKLGAPCLRVRLAENSSSLAWWCWCGPLAGDICEPRRGVATMAPTSVSLQGGIDPSLETVTGCAGPGLLQQEGML